jgi:hypothetical protein
VAMQVALLAEDVEAKVRAGYRPGSNACMGMESARCPIFPCEERADRPMIVIYNKTVQAIIEMPIKHQRGVSCIDSIIAMKR